MHNRIRSVKSESMRQNLVHPLHFCRENFFMRVASAWNILFMTEWNLKLLYYLGWLNWRLASLCWLTIGFLLLLLHEAGSSRVILSRSFTEHCVLALDNLPRKLLLYFSNVVNPMQSYFQTVICNSPEFRNTTVGSDLSQLLWHTTAHLKQSHTEESKNSRASSEAEFMGVQTGSIDRSIHGCCSSWSDDINHVKPGPLGEKLARIVSELVATKRKQACLWTSHGWYRFQVNQNFALVKFVVSRNFVL